VRLRLLAESDSIESLTLLIRAAYQPLGDAGLRYTGTWQDAAKTRERVAKGECWIAELDDAIVGTILLLPHGTQAYDCDYRRPGVAVASQFAVDPPSQGRGIGSALMRRVEERARELGATELAVDTAVPAQHLVALYERWGYVRVDEVQWGDTNYRSIILAKRLV
jgi:GNAT superfamily N-acetyltransferase